MNLTDSMVPVASVDTLVEAGRNIEVPFALRVVHGKHTEVLEFVRILRLLPCKRIVAVAKLHGREFLVKAYLGRSAARYVRREQRGVELIVSAGVRTPALRWHGRLVDGQGEVLVFDYLPDAVSLYDRWREAQLEEEKVDVLTRAMVIIGKLHNEGVVQNDIHLANFLLSSGRLFTIDGGDIVKRSRPPLAEAASLRNLGMFFAQFYPRHDNFARVVLPAYEAVRGWTMDESRLERIAREITANREKRKRIYISKAFRECTRFVCERSFTRFEVCERSAYSPEMQALLADPDAMIQSGTLLKDGSTSTVALVHLPDRSLVIKRYNLKSPWHRLRRAFRRTRAWHSWANACRMEFLGIPAVRPVALVEHRYGPLRGKAYFITEYVEGEDALACLKRLKNPDDELKALSSLLHDLSDSRISHGDMKATNFLISDAGPVILDLDAMREHKTREGFRRAFRRDLRRFMQNWQDKPELANRFAGLIGHLST